MSSRDGRRPGVPEVPEAPGVPDDLLPAQLGVILVGRPTLGHAAATLVSLAERGMLTVTETEAGEGPGDWMIGPPSAGRRSAGRPRRGHGAPARFERPLLDLPGASSATGLASPVSLSELTEDPEGIAPALRQFGRELVKDAVRHGWLHGGWPGRTRRDQRTPGGEKLAERARSFRATLRRRKATGGDAALADRLPYALAFGLISADSASPDSASAGNTAPGGIASRGGLPLARFAAAFTAACSDLPDWRHPEHKHEFPDVGAVEFTRDEWRGLPPGGHVIF
ncbi:MAG: hypothetical protein J2P25_08040 [Nocardiopsaceae bacterium]|nr:hypothetical protein [Nocardiopsaceae bacterium]